MTMTLVEQTSSCLFRGAMLLVAPSCSPSLMLPVVTLSTFSWKLSLTFPDISPAETPPREDAWCIRVYRGGLEPANLTSCLLAVEQSADGA